MTMDSTRLKRLSTRKNELETKLKEAEAVRLEADEEAVRLRQKLEKVKETEEYLTKDVVVSEHAVLRYFERILGYDLEEIRRKILPVSVQEQVRKLRGGTFPVGKNGDAFHIVVKQQVVVTVLPKEHA